MKFGIRRRTIDLMPPSPEDADWVFGSGGQGSASTRAAAKKAYLAGNFVVGVIHQNEEQKRVGFIMLIPVGSDHWDFTVMIPEPSDRDLFSALHACDASAHYLLDHLGMAAAVWRIREDNVRAQMLGRRLGYPQTGVVEQHKNRFLTFMLDRETWAARKAKLERQGGGEAIFAELR